MLLKAIFIHNTIKMYLSSYRHSYHLVDASPWPILASASAFIFALD